MKGFKVTASLVAFAICGELSTCVAGSPDEVVDSGTWESDGTTPAARGARPEQRPSVPEDVAVPSEPRLSVR